MIVLLIAVTALTGCARPAGPVFEPLAAPLRWPSAPEPARIEYVGQIATEHDLKAGRNHGEAIGATIFAEIGLFSFTSQPVLFGELELSGLLARFAFRFVATVLLRLVCASPRLLFLAFHTAFFHVEKLA